MGAVFSLFAILGSVIFLACQIHEEKPGFLEVVGLGWLAMMAPLLIFIAGLLIAFGIAMASIETKYDLGWVIYTYAAIGIPMVAYAYLYMFFLYPGSEKDKKDTADRVAFYRECERKALEYPFDDDAYHYTCGAYKFMMSRETAELRFRELKANELFRAGKKWWW